MLPTLWVMTAQLQRLAVRLGQMVQMETRPPQTTALVPAEAVAALKWVQTQAMAAMAGSAQVAAVAAAVAILSPVARVATAAMAALSYSYLVKERICA